MKFEHRILSPILDADILDFDFVHTDIDTCLSLFHVCFLFFDSYIISNEIEETLRLI